MDHTLQVLIVEDDLSFAIELKMLVRRMGYEVIDMVDHSARALEVIFSKEPDFILMDIDIKGELSGLQIGERIRHLDIPILFITSYGDEEHYAVAKRSNLTGYLVKPIDRYSLETAIDLAFYKTMLSRRSNVPAPPTTEGENDLVVLLQQNLFVKKRGVYHRLALHDIAFVSADENYCLLVTIDGEEFTVRHTFSGIEQLLDNGRFLRIHRSHLVQVPLIESINFQESTVQLVGRDLPMSRTRRRAVEQMIQTLS